MGNVQTAASAQEVLWRQGPGGELVDLGRVHRAAKTDSQAETGRQTCSKTAAQSG